MSALNKNKEKVTFCRAISPVYERFLNDCGGDPRVAAATYLMMNGNHPEERTFYLKARKPV